MSTVYHENERNTIRDGADLPILLPNQGNRKGPPRSTLPRLPLLEADETRYREGSRCRSRLPGLG